MSPHTPEKHILYSGHDAAELQALLADLAGVPGCTAVAGRREPTFDLERMRVVWTARSDVDELIDDLQRRYINLLIVDLRCDEDRLKTRADQALAALRRLDQTEDLEARYGFHRILVLLAGRQSAAIDRLILELGALGVKNVLRDPPPGSGGPGIAGRLHHEMLRLLAGRRAGKKALCSAGGGITGIFFELGALKCLDDCMDGRGVNDFDMYFGISAGAVVNGPLAVGYSIDEWMAAVAGAPGGRIAPVDLRLIRLGHLNLMRFATRATTAVRTAWGGVKAVLHGGDLPTRDELLYEYADLVAPPFRADRFERMIRGVLEQHGATNDFRELVRPLYVGTTDQDERVHVLFGDEANDDVPISLAIQASLSLNPAFSATRIRGRYYEDGAITRTSNFTEAIRRGATFVIVLDPFVPFITRSAGHADRRGVLYNIDQDVRTISYTRYEMSRNWVLRRHPEVSSYTLVPANRLRRLMSTSPMDHRTYLEIWRGAYLSTLSRIKRVRHRMTGDMAAHGVRLDCARAEAVAARLEATPRPTLADFFPDGKVVIKQYPLCMEGRPTTRRRA